MDSILKNPTSKLLFVVAELYQSREIDENHKRLLKGKHSLVDVIFVAVERIFMNDKNL